MVGRHRARGQYDGSDSVLRRVPGQWRRQAAVAKSDESDNVRHERVSPSHPTRLQRCETSIPVARAGGSVIGGM